MRRTIAVLAVLVLVIGSVGCGSDTGATEDPPWGLDSVDLPDDVDSIERVFAAMPDDVAGLARLDAGPNEADYEGDALVTVMQLGTPTENVSATNALEFLRRLSEAGKVGEVEMEQERLDGPLVYTIYDTTGNGRHVYLISWGAPGSEFLFGVKAESPEDRMALVQAFVEASSRG